MGRCTWGQINSETCDAYPGQKPFAANLAATGLVTWGIAAAIHGPESVEWAAGSGHSSCCHPALDDSSVSDSFT